MILVDAREGVSGDMLLAAMLGLLDRSTRSNAEQRLADTCGRRKVEFHVMELEDGEEKGLGIAYIDRSDRTHGLPYQEAMSTLSEIDRELGSSGQLSMRILDLLFDAESRAHGVAREEVHLHELGRTPALVNIAGIGFAAPRIARSPDDRMACTTITVGKGTVVTSHGPVSVPAPATALLLQGMRSVPGAHPGERATPTGAAALRALVSSQSDDIPVTCDERSVGFGSKRFGGRLGRVAICRARERA